MLEIRLNIFFLVTLLLYLKNFPKITLIYELATKNQDVNNMFQVQGDVEKYIYTKVH